MRVEYDAERDLVYLWFCPVGSKAARTVTVCPGVHVDLDRDGKLVGIEVLDAKVLFGDPPKLEMALPPSVKTALIREA